MKTPRNGSFGWNTGNAEIIKIDPQSGTLAPVGSKLSKADAGRTKMPKADSGKNKNVKPKK